MNFYVKKCDTLIRLKNENFCERKRQARKTSKLLLMKSDSHRGSLGCIRVFWETFEHLSTFSKFCIFWSISLATRQPEARNSRRSWK